MTSTPYNVGLDLNARRSSRVLRPPGGGHTDIFGCEPEPPRVARQQQPVTEPALLEEPVKPTNGTDEIVKDDPQTEDVPMPVTAPEQKEDPVVTTKTEPKAPQQPAATEPPKRVRVPPGGFSSRLW